MAHYEAKGYTVLAPAYPGFEVEVEALNADPTPIEQVTVAADHRAPRGGRRRARHAADPDGPLGRRRVHPDPARPRLRRRRRGDQLGADRGRQADPALAGAGDVPGAQEPGQPPQGRRLHVRAVALRVHQHASPRRSRGGSTSATTSPRPGTIFWGSALANIHPGKDDNWVDYKNDRARAAAVHLGQRGPPDAAEHPAVQRQALQRRRCVTEVKEFEGPHLLPSRAGLGAGRRLRARLGARARQARRVRTSAHPHRRADDAHRGRRAGGCSPTRRSTPPAGGTASAGARRRARSRGRRSPPPTSAPIDAVLLTHDHHGDNLDDAGAGAAAAGRHGRHDAVRREAARRRRSRAARLGDDDARGPGGRDRDHRHAVPPRPAAEPADRRRRDRLRACGGRARSTAAVDLGRHRALRRRARRSAGRLDVDVASCTSAACASRSPARCATR